MQVARCPARSFKQPIPPTPQNDRPTVAMSRDASARSLSKFFCRCRNLAFPKRTAMPYQVYMLACLA